MFIAHRGRGKHKYLENTKEAIINVLNEDVDGVEFDIRMTKDRRFVIHHDPIVKGLIIKFTKLKELKKIYLKDNIKLSTLTEVLDKIKTNKKIVIEIKSELDDYDMLVKKLYNIVKRYNLNIYVCSFNKKVVDKLASKFDKVGLLIGYYINKNDLINNYDYNIIHYDYKDKIDKAKETFIFTINDKKKLESINYESNIITDKYYLIK